MLTHDINIFLQFVKKIFHVLCVNHKSSPKGLVDMEGSKIGKLEFCCTELFSDLREVSRKRVNLDSAIFCVRSRLEKGRHLTPVALVRTHLGSVGLSLEVGRRLSLLALA